jgi:integrase
VATTDYLKLRHSTWYVRVQIPRHLWAAAGGRREYVKSLKTADLHDANRRKHAFVAEFKRRLAALERQLTDPYAALYVKALEFRDAYESAKQTGELMDPGGPHEEPVHAFLLSEIGDEANELLRTIGPEVAKRFHRLASGTGTFPQDVLETWLSEQDHITEQTRVQHRAAVRAFIAWAGDALTIEETTRRRAGDYVRSLRAAGRGFSPKTAQRHVSSLSVFWTWLAARGLAEDEKNPWLRQGLGRKTTRGQAPQRGQWEDAGLVKLLTGEMTPQYTETLHDLIRLALVTGARLGELCALRTTDVKKRDDGWWWVTIREGKTRAAVRDVPIHESAAHVLERRRDSPDGFVFPGLIPGGPDKQRSWNASKAFTRYRRKLGLSAPGQVFHSLRNTFIEAMEAAAVPESTVKLIVGHKRASLTYGHYSQGQRVNLREAISALRYPQEVMKLIGAREPRGDYRKAASGEAAAAVKQATGSKNPRTPRRGARRVGTLRTHRGDEEGDHR